MLCIVRSVKVRAPIRLSSSGSIGIGAPIEIEQLRRGRGRRAPGGRISRVPVIPTGRIGQRCSSARRAAPV